MAAEFDRKIYIQFDDGVTRPVLLNNGAKIEAEGAVRDAEGNPTPFYRMMFMEGLTPLRALLWAGLRGADRELRVGPRQLTLEATGDLLDLIDHGELNALLALAVVAADRTTTEDTLKKAREAADERIRAVTTADLPASDATRSDQEG